MQIRNWILFAPIPDFLLCAKRIGWHMFRHTFSNLLRANGEDVKTVQELLRHSSARVTLDLYSQAITQDKRDAQSRLVKMFATEAFA